MKNWKWVNWGRRVKKRGRNKREGGGRGRKRGIYSEAAHCRGEQQLHSPLIQTITPGLISAEII